MRFSVHSNHKQDEHSPVVLAAMEDHDMGGAVCGALLVVVAEAAASTGVALQEGALSEVPGEPLREREPVREPAREPARVPARVQRGTGRPHRPQVDRVQESSESSAVTISHCLLSVFALFFEQNRLRRCNVSAFLKSKRQS